jgi:hypothetical protein
LENAIRDQAAVKASVLVEPLSETAKMLVRPKFEVHA